MAIKPWSKIGKPSILADEWGKSFIHQKFLNPKTNKAEDFTFFSSPRDAMVVLPVTIDNNILVISQFRHAANNIFMELPGGNKNSGETPLEAAKRELLEETGYSTRVMFHSEAIRIWADPGAFESAIWPFLALDCERIKEPQLDITECMEVLAIPIHKWLRMIKGGLITDCKTLAITMLFLSYLEERVNKGEK